MPYKRILTIQDISCVGQCSMTVALPILSALGHETSILPTAILSTHTGGFGKPAVTHLDGSFEAIRRHWQENGITFDAILTGYLGSIPAVEAAGKILDAMLVPGGVAIVDPVLGDNGTLYSGFDEAYVRAVGCLCEKADILLPNETEVTFLWNGQLPADKEIIVTGVAKEQGRTGFLHSHLGQRRYYAHDRIGGSCHGTGDIFAAVFTGARMQGEDSFQAAKIAANFVCRCIENTVRNPAHGYGVKFEPLLGELTKMVP